MLKDFRTVTWELANTATLAEITRPLLATLDGLSGLECAFLTRVDRRRYFQTVLFTHVTDADADADAKAESESVSVPQGFRVPWDEGLCMHALKNNVHYTMAADRLWPDNRMVRELGVRTFFSQPIRDTRSAIVGTLCAASGRRVAMAPDALPGMRLFARLIGLHIEHRQRLTALQDDYQQRNVRAVDEAVPEFADREGLKSALHRAYGLAGSRVALAG